MSAAVVSIGSSEVEAESIRLQYEGMHSAFASSGVLATVVAVIFQQHGMPAMFWASWLFLVYLHVLARVELRRRFLKKRPPRDEIGRWGQYAVLGTLASGVLWGVGTVLGQLYAKGAMDFLLVPLIILISIAAVISAISYIAVYYAFVIPATLPGVAYLVAASDALHVMTATAYLCFLIMMARFAHVLNDSFLSTVRLRFENAELIAALRAEKSVAEEANKAKSRFLAAASHDLRQPMHALRFFVESYPTLQLPDAERALMTNIRRSISDMGLMFDELMNMSRLDAGVVSPCPEHFSLRPFMTKLYREFLPIAEARKLQLRLRTLDISAHTDPLLLGRILANLLSNAIRYGARQGVLLAARQRAGRLAIDVWDTGIGIAESEREAIFQEFYQVGNAERDREKGLGLGLAIVDRLAKLLGLGLECKSQLGVGSMFRVLVPLGDPTRVPAQTEDVSLGAQTARDCPDILIAVIDDERTVREATSALLRQWGCRVTCAGSVAEYLLAIQTDASADVPGLIIADLRLRDGDSGIDAVATLRRHHRQAIPAVILSGDTSPERLHLVQQSGLMLLHKPLPPEILRTLIADAAQADG